MARPNGPSGAALINSPFNHHPKRFFVWYRADPSSNWWRSRNAKLISFSATGKQRGYKVQCKWAMPEPECPFYQVLKEEFIWSVWLREEDLPRRQEFTYADALEHSGRKPPKKWPASLPGLQVMFTAAE